MSSRRRSAEEWRELVDQWEVSGLSAADFAEPRRMNPRTLGWWKGKLGQRSPKPSSPPSFIELVVLPATFVRHKIVVEKVVYPDHRGDETRTVVTAPPPVPNALPKAMCGNGLLAQILIDKYADHLPLHRQEARFQREGMALSRQTMCARPTGRGGSSLRLRREPLP